MSMLRTAFATLMLAMVAKAAPSVSIRNDSLLVMNSTEQPDVTSVLSIAEKPLDVSGELLPPTIPEDEDEEMEKLNDDSIKSNDDEDDQEDKEEEKQIMDRVRAEIGGDVDEDSLRTVMHFLDEMDDQEDELKQMDDDDNEKNDDDETFLNEIPNPDRTSRMNPSSSLMGHSHVIAVEPGQTPTRFDILRAEVLAHGARAPTRVLHHMPRSMKLLGHDVPSRNWHPSRVDANDDDDNGGHH
ncbi:unnamed protein product [Notodromas monacha]|uniref:Uncharacterized protein n=1 Tax=Notodromas monacha TaxID=399045 RepID=A0A7R9GFK7_9CRUS|nr:unnamed protein product [Notodromas monacha]CAG0920881.1 unnamed protein product [Notodromas monacha]